MTARTTLSEDRLDELSGALRKAAAGFARRYPGESSRPQPVHTFYGGAHLFRSDSAPKLGAAALRSLDEHAPEALPFARGLAIADGLAETVYSRIREKLRREPVEDFRIDFEDGYGSRPDEEEDDHAESAARELAAGHAAGTLPPSVGIRIKALTGPLRGRSVRTLDLFVTELVRRTGGRLPGNFVVTLPKVTLPEEVSFLAAVLGQLEEALGLPEKTVALEIMIETPQALLNDRGKAAALSLVEAAEERCVGAHFGTYDYTASLNLTAAYQTMTHPACDFARHLLQVSLAGTGVWLSDGGTNVLPIARDGDSAGVLAGWKLHYEHVRHSLASGYYQGWDLHPAQLPTRYAALYAFFLEGLEPASARLTNFVRKAGQATRVGEVFDDAATGQGLLNYFLRAWSCGAITEEEAIEKSGLTVEELRSRSFAGILEKRRKG